MRTPIAYYGGKISIRHHILPLIPEHKLYTEAFFGGGTVFFEKEPVPNETINDRWDIAINFYQVLKNRYQQLKELIDQSLISRTQHLHATYICQKKVPASELQMAWAFWYACNFSMLSKVGGGLRYSNGSNTMITTTMKNKKQAFTEQLATRLESTHIENKDALEVLKARNTPEAFHFIDPPYVDSDLGHYPGWTEKNQFELLDWLATSCRGKFILTSYENRELKKIIEKAGWTCNEIVDRLKSPRRLIGRPAEYLIKNF